MRFFKTCVAPLTVLYFLLLMTGCHESKKVSPRVFNLNEDLLREGDLLFRRGTGIASQMVLVADTKGVYSHIGILVKEEGRWKVVHAVPGEPDFEGDIDRVKIEELQDFFDASKAVRGAVMRVKDDSICHIRAALHAIRLFKAHVLFDHSYNNKDSTELYCSELIQLVYAKEGIDLVEGRISRINIPGLKGEFILPSDIQTSSHLNLIYDF